MTTHIIPSPYDEISNIFTTDCTFLASSHLATSIHWPCSCTDYIIISGVMESMLASSTVRGSNQRL